MIYIIVQMVQEYTKDQIKKNKIILDDLIKLVQQTVNDCIPDYEVNIYK